MKEGGRVGARKGGGRREGTREGREGARGWWGRREGEGRDGARGGREEAMMLDRQRASVKEGGGLSEGWLMNGTRRKGRDEVWTAGGRN